MYNNNNNNPVRLGDLIEAIETALGKTAKKRLMPMQPGDVAATYANIDDLAEIIDYRPNTSIEHGIGEFIRWYLDTMHKESQ